MNREAAAPAAEWSKVSELARLISLIESDTSTVSIQVGGHECNWEELDIKEELLSALTLGLRRRTRDIMYQITPLNDSI